RAHFVRTQVALARVPEWDPLWAKCRQLESEVFLGWGMAHTLPQPLPTGFDWRYHRFRRGFPWLARALTAEAVVARADGLFGRAPVQALNLDDARPNLAALAETPHLARLRRLEFSLSRLDAPHLVPLLESPHAGGLTELAFETDAITPDGLEALAGSGLFGRLEALELSHNAPRLSPVLLVDALGAATRPRLRKLGLAFAGLPAPDAATLFALPVVRGLDHLDLSNNPLGPDGVAALAEARGVRGVSVLKLGETKAGVAGVEALAASGVLAGVRWLDLSGNRLGPVAVGKLAGSRQARGLRVLKLSDNRVEDKGAAALAASPHLAGLVELDLEDAGVKDAGMIALAESPHLDNLVRLDLRDRQTRRPPGAEARRALLERFGPRVSFNQ
ncbi:MAG: hypothetical protein K2X82_27965, partial [Gemmataceae bacterium]|nr:hypothetical protein [Gemmataceae bacterium]